MRPHYYVRIDASYVWIHFGNPERGNREVCLMYGPMQPENAQRICDTLNAAKLLPPVIDLSREVGV